MTPRFTVSLLAAAALAAATSAPAEPTQPVLPPADQRFKAVSSTLDALPRLLPASVAAKVLASVRSNRCPGDGVSIHRKPGTKVVILLVPCEPAQLGESPKDLVLFEYPLTFVIRQEEVSEVDFSQHGFMYQSGGISAITDVDRNGTPELWLTGSVCECDGQPEDYGFVGCQCAAAYVKRWASQDCCINPLARGAIR